MDSFGPNRLPNRKLSASERFLCVPSHAPPHFSNSVASNDELHEDDVVFFSSDYGAEHNHHSASTSSFSSSSSSSSSATPNHHHHHNHHHPHGILAALPENGTSRNFRNVSQHFHKASISSISSASSSSSSSRVIPSIPRPPPPAQSSVMFHQSAPVNVPILSMKARRRHCDFDDNDEDEDGEEDEDEEMVPPHEFVARNSDQSPMLAYSVLEGIGRTLKGRDMRQVRNAVWRQTVSMVPRGGDD
ncbi:putative protein TPRXL isoform X1 [Glycine max]|uniref:putative protein TPRXL isoform X1 n=1 Tax=Glycine max TaxID=3847 RepID=UPI0003DE8576|nr:putative protein TPRXL isoform X1 [Glycine max]